MSFNNKELLYRQMYHYESVKLLNQTNTDRDETRFCPFCDTC